MRIGVFLGSMSGSPVSGSYHMTYVLAVKQGSGRIIGWYRVSGGAWRNDSP